MAKHWCFTDNSRLEVKDWEAKSLTAAFADKIEYLVVGMEKAPTTGQLHGQGYLKLIKQDRFTGLKKTLGLPAVHLEVKKGTPIQAVNYCIHKDPKEEEKLKDAKDIFEYGERPTGAQQGKRNDLEDGIKILKEGGTINDIAQEYPHLIVKYPSGFVKLAALLKEAEVPLERTVDVFWLWGKTGTGKTHAAIWSDPEDCFIFHGFQLQKGNFCSYKGQGTLVIDEFAHQCKISYLLSLLDKVKLELEVKYGSTFAQWHTVFVTTNINYPHAVYPGANDNHRAALFRRIKKAVHFTTVYEPGRETTPIMWDVAGDESFGDVTTPDSPLHGPTVVSESRFIFDEESEEVSMPQPPSQA